MKILSKLNLSDDDIGDMGVTEIIVAARQYCSLEVLDLSGNNLGKSPASTEMAD
jgi:Ran GTPase-activating protein (RanGAP) involved in mRNA processing and transport